jgi:hypothetical protein
MDTEILVRYMHCCGPLDPTYCVSRVVGFILPASCEWDIIVIGRALFQPK